MSLTGPELRQDEILNNQLRGLVPDGSLITEEVSASEEEQITPEAEPKLQKQRVPAREETDFDEDRSPEVVETSDEPEDTTLERFGIQNFEDSTAMEAKLFGRLRFSNIVDQMNNGDNWDLYVLPPGNAREAQVASIINDSVIGLSASQRLPGNWIIVGRAVLGYIGQEFTFPYVYVDAEKEGGGVRLRLGRMFQPVVSPLFAKVSAFVPGDIYSALQGGVVSYRGHNLLADFGLGTVALTPRIVQNTGPLSVSPYPSVEGRLGYLGASNNDGFRSESRTLQVSVSGSLSLVRYGVGESDRLSDLEPGATAPRVENIVSWLVSQETSLPIANAMITGEVHLGTATNSRAGATFQGARIDPGTGEHIPLKSLGAWGEFRYTFTSRLEFIILGGMDAVLSGLDGGVDLQQFRAIERNYVLQGGLRLSPLDPWELAITPFWMQTHYQDAQSSRNLGLLLQSDFYF